MANLQAQHFDAAIENVKNKAGNPVALENVTWSGNQSGLVFTPDPADPHKARIDLNEVGTGYVVTATADGRPGDGVKHMVFETAPFDVVENPDAVEGTINLGPALD